MTITAIPIGIIYTILEMVNQHDYQEEVTIDGELIDRKSGSAPYAIGRPFQKLEIRLLGRRYVIENGLAYVQEET